MDVAVVILLGSLFVLGIVLVLTRWLVPKTLTADPVETAPDQ